jgi:hypothetical protein
MADTGSHIVARRIAWGLIAAGIALHAYIDLFLSARPISVFGFLGVIGWPSLPYVVCAVVLRVWGNVRAAIGGSATALILDALTVYAVFIHPTTSTAPLAMMFVPLWSLLLFTPLGLSVGWLADRRIRSRKSKLPMPGPVGGEHRGIGK